MGVYKNDSTDSNCITPKQADCIYRKVELGSQVDKNTMKEEIDIDIELDKMDNNSADDNPYRKLIVNNAGKIKNMLSQMEQWSILSNVINYVQYSKNPKNFHTMSIKPINKNKINVQRKRGEKDKFATEVSLMDTADKLTEEYLDRYEGVKSKILNTIRFKNPDLSTTYLGRSNMDRDHKIVAEERYPISEQGYTTGKLLDDTKCQILLDTGTRK